MAAHRKIALVTGASSGIGLACGEHLVARGWRVYGASRSAPQHSSFETVPMDVRDDASVINAVTAIAAREGRIDAVINNAGIAIAGAVEDTSIDEAQAQFGVNLFGVLRVCRAVLPIMREQRAGHIVNIGSIAGLVAVPYQGLYSASKFALEGLTESLRLEVRDFGIRVALIEPGDHRTGLTAHRSRTAGSHTNPAYREKCDRAVDRMAADEQSGPAPEQVAFLVNRVVNASNPRLRYTIGPAPERAAIWLKRLLPYSVVERIMGSYYGIRP